MVLGTRDGSSQQRAGVFGLALNQIPIGSKSAASRPALPVFPQVLDVTADFKAGGEKVIVLLSDLEGGAADPNAVVVIAPIYYLLAAFFSMLVVIVNTPKFRHDLRELLDRMKELLEDFSLSVKDRISKALEILSQAQKEVKDDQKQCSESPFLSTHPIVAKLPKNIRLPCKRLKTT